MKIFHSKDNGHLGYNQKVYHISNYYCERDNVLVIRLEDKTMFATLTIVFLLALPRINLKQ